MGARLTDRTKRDVWQSLFNAGGRTGQHLSHDGGQLRDRTHRDTCAHGYADADKYAHQHADVYTHTHRYTNADLYAHADGYTDSHEHADVYAHAHRYACRDCQSVTRCGQSCRGQHLATDAATGEARRSTTSH